MPVNTREALGVLHFKGFIIDDCVLYSGASLNDVYLHQHDKYRYDRYQCIRNGKMADVMFDWVEHNLVEGRGVNRLDSAARPKSPEIKMISASIAGNCVTAATISLAMRMTIGCRSRRWSVWANRAC